VTREDGRDGVERRTVFEGGCRNADGRLVLRCTEGRLPERATLGVDRVERGAVRIADGRE
jgi:hypothetical protein